MTKNDLIKKLQEELKTYSLKDVTYVVNIIFDSMIDAIKRGERIELRGFGSFEVRERKPRMGRNPKTGTQVKLTERKVPFFKTGKELRIMVDNKK
ncbi:MAG TPA: integration host factor subunit beta [Smithella sp.]|jgi:integration host factor beta subunit|nr:integration host factor subunit beta [Smithella sp.]OQC52167.1 MAG: Integration host factor subunit beta [Deltaproteobacteria bacterium ADurb.Bin022]HNQ64737.1 integration host factor subunit beta [Smithella sp.]HOE32350.1 integration host factor subunit beta [Smithella sp.]HOG08955.1 integration host factor subunit beta [Smithella sp.]